MTMQSILLACLVSASLVANVYGGFLIAEHPIGLEVNSTGVSVTLQCRATSEGEITHWLQDGSRIDAAALSGVDISTTPGAGGTSTLTISSYETTHAGDYRCAASSVLSQALVEVSHGALVSHFTLRTFTKQPQDFTVYTIFNNEESTPAREAAALNCEFASLPRYGRRPVILWEYESTRSNTSTVLEQSGSMMISTFQFDHIGYFQLHSPISADSGSRVRCIARHPQDETQEVKSDWATIATSDLPRPNDFPVLTTTMPSKVYRIEGQRLVLGCSKSTPVSSVPLQWLDSTGGVFFTAGVLLIFTKPGFSPYGSSNVLVQDDVIDANIGDVFTCRATLEFSDVTWNVTLVQAPPPLPPLRYSDQHQAHTIDYGTVVRLDLDTSANEYTGRIQWWVNGVLITDTPQKYALSVDMRSLTVSNIIFNDAGVYQADLLDAEPPQFLNFQIDVRGGEAFVLGGESEVLAESGSSYVRLPCNTTGNVPPVTTHAWSLNGVDITADGVKYSVGADGSLTITNLQLADAGTYSCSPENTLGSFNSTSIRLDVSASVNITWSDVEYPLVGGATNINCITPFPDGLAISSSGVLSATNVQPGFSGEYQCQLTPPHDGDVIINVRVIGGGEAFVLGGQSEVLAESGSSYVMLPCDTTGNVPPVTTHAWSLNGLDITADGVKYSIGADGSLTITNLQLADAGTYSCSPENALGSFNSTSLRLDVSATISVNWTIDFDQVLVPGASGVRCATPLPAGMTISAEGVLMLSKTRLNHAGQYTCQPSPTSEANIIVNLEVQGYPPEIPKIIYIGIVNKTNILVNWTTASDPLRPVDTYTLTVRTTTRDKAESVDRKEGEESHNGITSENFTISGATNKHVIPGADFKLIYSFRVAAKNSISQSEFSPEVDFDGKLVDGGGVRQTGGLMGWEIALIVIFIILLILLCCILLLCVFLCWRREKKSYYAAKREQQDKNEYESYRKTEDADTKN